MQYIIPVTDKRLQWTDIVLNCCDGDIVQISCDSTMHALAVYVKVELPFALKLPFETPKIPDSFLYFWLALLYSVSWFVFLCGSVFSSLCSVFDDVSSSIDNHSAKEFVLGDLVSMIETGQPNPVDRFKLNFCQILVFLGC